MGMPTTSCLGLGALHWGPCATFCLKDREVWASTLVRLCAWEPRPKSGLVVTMPSWSVAGTTCASDEHIPKAEMV